MAAIAGVAIVDDLVVVVVAVAVVAVIVVAGYTIGIAETHALLVVVVVVAAVAASLAVVVCVAVPNSGHIPGQCHWHHYLQTFGQHRCATAATGVRAHHQASSQHQCCGSTA